MNIDTVSVKLQYAVQCKIITFEIENPNLFRLNNLLVSTCLSHTVHLLDVFVVQYLLIG